MRKRRLGGLVLESLWGACLQGRSYLISAASVRLTSNDDWQAPTKIYTALDLLCHFYCSEAMWVPMRILDLCKTRRVVASNSNTLSGTPYLLRKKRKTHLLKARYISCTGSFSTFAFSSPLHSWRLLQTISNIDKDRNLISVQHLECRGNNHLTPASPLYWTLPRRPTFWFRAETCFNYFSGHSRKGHSSDWGTTANIIFRYIQHIL